MLTVITSDSVIRVNDTTRVTTVRESDTIRVKLRNGATPLESSRVFFTETLDPNNGQGPETRARVIFT